MKNILFFVLTCAFLVGCETSEEKDSITAAQRNFLAQFTASTTMVFQAIDASGIYARSNRSLPKAISEEMKNCDRSPQYDGGGRRIGVITGGNCPIAASWVIRSNGANMKSVDASYRNKDDEFTQILPVVLMSLTGSREVVSFGSRYRMTVSYAGVARDTSSDEVRFQVQSEKVSNSREELAVASLPESTYTIRVSFRDFTAEGKMVDGRAFYLNGMPISREEFDNLFFVLR